MATPVSVFGNDASEVIANAKADSLIQRIVDVNGVKIRSPFPSPEDWRDVWIYFLMIDRFNNPASQPLGADPCLSYQGGKFKGVKDRLGYLKDLGVGAIWLSPVLMNPPGFPHYYGGYATLDFLRVEPRFCLDPAAALKNPEKADRELRGLVDAAHARDMYVIFDIVLNHAGDLFDYEGMQDAPPWRDSEYGVYWRDGRNTPRGEWPRIEDVPGLPRDAGVWPRELQRNDYFRRKGDVSGSRDVTRGDFGSLRELVTEYYKGDTGTYPVRDILIRAYQYLIAKFDVDGFRVDTLMYVERDFARAFANAMREFALSIGKKNFFTFGEVWMDDDEAKIAEYVGRDTVKDDSGIVGFDAALDFPLRKRLEGVCKGTLAPAALADHMDYRRETQKTVLSSHGDAGAYFVTFLENHDMTYRYAAGCRPEQVTLALTCLFTLQGVPCLYYGMEQGFDMTGPDRESARHCLWRDPPPFDNAPQHPYYQAVQQLAGLRKRHPALRYGRQYFRPLTGNGTDASYSGYAPGVLAYSRLLNDTEIMVVANTSRTEPAEVQVLADRMLNPPDQVLKVIFSNLPQAGLKGPEPVRHSAGRAFVPVHLRPMEVQVLGKES